jgi:UDP-N-acetylmuramate dehydrogenase
MRIQKNISLKPYNTFGIDCQANCVIHIKTEREAKAFFMQEFSWKKPLLILGGGSNILFINDFKGTILCPEFGRIRIEEQNNENVIISAGAGINWDKLVEWAVNFGFGGLENLSLIPGHVGAASVQNIGAYGVEVKDTIIKVRTISVADDSVRFFSNEECKFGYRNSVFKNEEKGKYLVTRVWFKLKIHPEPHLGYGSLKKEVKKFGAPNLKNIRKAIINIRQSKLPDPKVIGNAGSFFKNPVVRKPAAGELKKKYPQIIYYDDPSGGTKLAAGWLIEQCGWKGKRTGNAGVYDKQALVLVNHGKATGKEIFDFSEEIRKSVRRKFGVELDREVEVVGTI